MIVRKDEYKVDEAAFLLDLPARAILSLCDAKIIKCSRIVANGAKQQRAKRFISHCEIVRFNATRPSDSRSDLASRLVDPEGPEQMLLSIVQPEAEADDDSAVWLSKSEWRTIVAGVSALGRTMPVLIAIGEKLGPGGANVIAKGLKVRNYEGIAG